MAEETLLRWHRVSGQSWEQTEVSWFPAQGASLSTVLLFTLEVGKWPNPSSHRLIDVASTIHGFHSEPCQELHLSRRKDDLLPADEMENEAPPTTTTTRF